MTEGWKSAIYCLMHSAVNFKERFLLLMLALGVILGPAVASVAKKPAVARKTSGAKQPVLRPNVLLITIDTLRANHLSCYGYHKITSPRIDRFASQGARFDRAYTTVPQTGPAHASLLTGRYPQETGARVNGQPMANDPRVLPLQRILKRNGYRTGAFVSAWPLKDRLTHLRRGFDVYNEKFTKTFQLISSYRPAEDVTPKAIHWLQMKSRMKKKRPFFLWVHFFDPHSPYELKEKYADHPLNPSGTLKTTALNKEMATRIRSYDSEIAHTDHHVGLLLDELEKLGLRDSTVVIVMADHGESLGEKGYVGHGNHIYEYISQIPLILSYPPAVAAGQIVNERVSLVDVMPTILDLVGIKPPFPLQGRSLRSYLNSSPPPARDTYIVTFSGKPGIAPKWLRWLWYSSSEKHLPLKIGHIRSDRKIIWTPARNKIEEYNLRLDRKEMKPIFAGKPNGQYKSSINGLKLWFESTNRHVHKPTKMKKKDIEVLRSLGYID